MLERTDLTINAMKEITALRFPEITKGHQGQVIPKNLKNTSLENRIPTESFLTGHVTRLFFAISKILNAFSKFHYTIRDSTAYSQNVGEVICLLT